MARPRRAVVAKLDAGSIKEPSEGIRRKVAKAVGKQTLFLISSANFSETVQMLVKIITNEMVHEAIYLSTHDSFRFLANYFNDELVDINKISFIDCVSKTMGIRVVNERIFLVDSVSNLGSIDSAVSNLMALLKGEDNFFILDSIEGLVISNSEKDSIDFIGQIVSKMRNLKMTGIYFAIKEERDSRMIQKLEKIFEQVIEI
ncbi:MAG: hypothetical protein ABID38_02540 [Candidatus Diapherotrites archaeon]